MGGNGDESERFEVFLIDSIDPVAAAKLAETCTVVDKNDPAIGEWPQRAHAIITRTAKVPGDLIAEAKRLKVIAKHGIGVDHIDVKAAKAHGIPVINTPGTNAQSVAELTMMLAIAAARNTRPAEAALRTGDPGDTFTWRGFDIAGRRVGIVGLGNVGRKTAPIFKHGLSCAVAAYDPYIDNTPFEALGVARAGSLDSLLQQTDILCLHVPLTEETHGMIGARELALLPREALVINAARGGIVDETALCDALTSGRIYAAGSDVFAVEPPSADHPLLQCPNFIATPHIGAATADSSRRSGETVVRLVLDILNGGDPVTLVY